MSRCFHEFGTTGDQDARFSVRWFLVRALPEGPMAPALPWRDTEVHQALAKILPHDRRRLGVVESIDCVDGAFGARKRRMVDTLQDQESLADWDALVGSGFE